MAKSAADKVDLVNHPDQANDPRIAGRILAQFLSDRFAGYQGKVEDGTDARRDGLESLLYNNKKKPPKAEQALTLYTTWLQEPAATSLSKPAISDNLRNNEWVRARAVVNGHHHYGLPNGLERFLPALVFADRHSEIVEAAQSPNGTKTLQDAVDIWTRGVAGYGDKDYPATLRKRLGFPKGTDLSKIKLSDLPRPMLQELLAVEREYALDVENSLASAWNHKVTQMQRMQKK